MRYRPWAPAWKRGVRAGRAVSGNTEGELRTDARGGGGSKAGEPTQGGGADEGQRATQSTATEMGGGADVQRTDRETRWWSDSTACRRWDATSLAGARGGALQVQGLRMGNGLRASSDVGDVGSP